MRKVLAIWVPIGIMYAETMLVAHLCPWKLRADMSRSSPMHWLSSSLLCKYRVRYFLGKFSSCLSLILCKQLDKKCVTV